jgi:hypothetical protein
VFQELKHGTYRPVLQLLQNQQISVGKCAQAIAELAAGCKPVLPSDYAEYVDPGNALDDALLRAEKAEQRIAELEGEKREQESILLSLGPITCRHDKQHEYYDGCLYCKAEKAEADLLAKQEEIDRLKARAVDDGK